MPLYLLDKNVLNYIRSSNLRVNIDPGYVKFARDIDDVQNIISLILAVQEGSNRTHQTEEELYNNIISATREVESFYKYARTDGKILGYPAIARIGAQILGSQSKEKIDKLIPLIREIKSTLHPQASTSFAPGKLKKIKELAVKYSLQQHPLIMSAIMCLYGNSDANGVIKPGKNRTDGDAYNVAFDIQLLMLTAIIQRIVKDKINSNEHVYLYSNDKVLNELCKILKVVADRVTQDGVVSFICDPFTYDAPNGSQIPSNLLMLMPHLAGLPSEEQASIIQEILAADLPDQ
jgi:hypothetical protein